MKLRALIGKEVMRTAPNKRGDVSYMVGLPVKVMAISESHALLYPATRVPLMDWDDDYWVEDSFNISLQDTKKECSVRSI